MTDKDEKRRAYKREWMRKWRELNPDRNRELYMNEPARAKAAARLKIWRDKNPEKRKAQSKRHYESSRGEQIKKSSEWNFKNRERKRDNELRRQYGITLDDYNNMMIAQGGRCLICSVVLAGAGAARPCLDHCHKTGKARAILCHKCNAGIGMFSESRVLLLKAAEYAGLCEQIKEGIAAKAGIFVPMDRAA